MNQNHITSLAATQSRLFYTNESQNITVLALQGGRVFQLRNKHTRIIEKVHCCFFTKCVAGVGDGSIVFWDISKSLEAVYCTPQSMNNGKN